MAGHRPWCTAHGSVRVRRCDLNPGAENRLKASTLFFALNSTPPIKTPSSFIGVSLSHIAGSYQQHPTAETSSEPGRGEGLWACGQLPALFADRVCARKLRLERAALADIQEDCIV